MFKFKGNTVPKKISPCPIKDTVAEVRFFDTIPIDVLSGLIFNALSNSSYKSKIKGMPERLPVNDIPLPMRSQDPNFKYQPHYNIKVDNNVELRIGLNSIAVSVIREYIGWTKYFENIKSLFALIENLKLITNIERFGLRYRSFFDVELFENIDWCFMISSNDFTKSKSYIRSEWEYNQEISCILQLTNNAIFNEIGKPAVNGSLIDLDIYSIKNSDGLQVINTVFDSYHSIEKEIFFNLLKPDFITAFNPEY